MKRPAYQWYPGDWKRDTAVQSCSFEARALWREMLDIMHDGKPYGHLTTDKVALTAADLARRLHVTTLKVERWLRELESWKVFSKTPKGVIYSRRMVRDEKVRHARAAGGVKSLDNKNVPQPKPEKRRTPRRISSRPSSAGSSGGSPSVAVASSASNNPPDPPRDETTRGQGSGKPTAAKETMAKVLADIRPRLLRTGTDDLPLPERLP